MKRASQYFSGQQRRMIEEAIAQAEKNTSGEIVTVVATASGRYDRAEDLFGLLFAMISLALCWLLFQQEFPNAGQWDNGMTSCLPLPAVIGITVIGFFSGTVLAALFPALRLIFIPKAEMCEEVERSASEAFHNFRLRGTQGATGVLLYVSLYERMITVKGDDAINTKLDSAAWKEICRIAVQGIKKRKPAEGLKAAIEQCGVLLTTHFPVEVDDRNELHNELNFID